MGRKLLIRSEEYPYHVTSRSNNKEWFYIPSKEVWKICQRLILEGEKKYNVKVDAFVLMSNHYHMLLYTPEANIDKFMHYFNQNLGRSISRSAGRINRIFCSNYKWSLIKNRSYYLNVVRYIYQNPIRAKIVKNIKHYPYSDYHDQTQHHKNKIWINTPYGAYDQEQTRKKLRSYII